MLFSFVGLYPVMGMASSIVEPGDDAGRAVPFFKERMHKVFSIALVHRMDVI